MEHQTQCAQPETHVPTARPILLNSFTVLPIFCYLFHFILFSSCLLWFTVDCTFWVQIQFVGTVKYCVLFSIWVYLITLDGNIHPTGDSVTLNMQKHNSAIEAFIQSFPFRCFPLCTPVFNGWLEMATHMMYVCHLTKKIPFS